MICKNCGTQNPEGASVCSQCQHPLEAPPQYYQQYQPGDGQNPPGYGQPPQPNMYAPPTGYQPGYQPGYQQAPPYGSPYQQNYYAQAQPGKGAATGSLVCGIISVFFAGLILGIIAIAQGRKAKRLGYIGGMATAGIVLGIIGLIGWVIIMILVIFGILSYNFLI